MKNIFLSPCHLRKDLLENTNFDCGEQSLNDWLCLRSYKNELKGASRTYLVLTEKKEIAAYCCLSSYSIFHSETKSSIKRNMPNPIPAIMLGRLAVDNKFKGQGLGKSLLKFVIAKAQRASLIHGVVGVISQPLSDNVRDFYIGYGFESLRKDSDKLIYLFYKN